MAKWRKRRKIIICMFASNLQCVWPCYFSNHCLLPSPASRMPNFRLPQLQNFPSESSVPTLAYPTTSWVSLYTSNSVTSILKPADAYCMTS